MIESNYSSTLTVHKHRCPVDTKFVYSTSFSLLHAPQSASSGITIGILHSTCHAKAQEIELIALC